MKWVQTGSYLSGRDCVIRAISIALKIPYDKVHIALMKEANKYHSARYKVSKGCHFYVYTPFLEKKKWLYHTLLTCHTDNAEDHLPQGRLIICTPGHLAACVKHTIYDTWDSRTKGGKGKKALRIFGYYKREN